MRSTALLSSTVPSTVFVFILVACGSSPAPKSVDPTPKQSAEPTPSSTTQALTTDEAPAKPPTAGGNAKTVAVDSIFGRVNKDLALCYEQGKKAAPKMTGGKITLHAEVEPDGKTSCVVPADDTGLTQEVEDCMADRIGKETFESGGAPWSYEMNLVVKNGKLSLGEDEAAVANIMHVEVHGLADDNAHEVAESLLPKFQQCMMNSDKAETLRVLHVGGRVGRDGKVVCAIASSPTPLPADVRECAAQALEKATFNPPKKGVGLISIPIKLMAKKKK